MALLLGAVLLLIAWRWSADRSAAKPTELRSHRVELNRASSGELQQLPGVGPKTADAIRNRRETIGDFQHPSNVTSVKGIGNAKRAKLEPWIDVEASCEESETVDSFPSQPRGVADNVPSKTKPLPVQPLDINTATAEELRTLPGIGPIISQRIVVERSKQSFAQIDDLRRVSGIGPKTLEKVRPHVTIGSK